MMLRKRKGFTLVELIVVMVILAILALILIPSFMNFRETAEKNTCQANQRTIRSAVALMIASSPTTPVTGDIAPATLAPFLGGETIGCPSGVAYTNINYDSTTGVTKVTCIKPTHNATSGPSTT